jgi:hypothetical protein
MDRPWYVAAYVSPRLASSLQLWWAPVRNQNWVAAQIGLG